MKYLQLVSIVLALVLAAALGYCSYGKYKAAQAGSSDKKMALAMMILAGTSGLTLAGLYGYDAFYSKC
jgi:hypothetical protein